MKRKNSTIKKEKKYAITGIIFIILILIIIGFILYKDVFNKSSDSKSKIIMDLDDTKIKSGENTALTITMKNKGDLLLEGNLIIIADDPKAVSISHQDPSVLNIKLYPGESVTRIFNVTGTTTAIRTDHKISAEIKKDNNIISSNDLILTINKN